MSHAKVDNARSNLATEIIKVRTNTRRKVQDSLNEKFDKDTRYIKELEKLLSEHGISLPERNALVSSITAKSAAGHILEDGSFEEVLALLENSEQFHRKFTITISFRDLGFWAMMPTAGIETVGSTFMKCLMGPGTMKRVDVLKGISGRLLPGKMTLLLGPPGSGKSTLLKALSGRLHLGQLKKEGEVYYNEESINSTKFLTEKVSEYIEQEDTHAATLTVEETMVYAWKSTTGGHHSYAFAIDDDAAEEVNRGDEKLSKVQNELKILGLYGVKNTYVGNAAIRGISGGQKRRVTLGEMIVTPRQVKFMDCISNGLDSATTFDIVQAIRSVCHIAHTTTLIALLQPPPEVFELFDEVMVLSEGQILYHGPRTQVMNYFCSIGYECPDQMDLADFLQIIPTSEGRFYLRDSPHRSAESLKASLSSSSSGSNHGSSNKNNNTNNNNNNNNNEQFNDYGNDDNDVLDNNNTTSTIITGVVVDDGDDNECKVDIESVGLPIPPSSSSSSSSVKVDVANTMEIMRTNKSCDNCDIINENVISFNNHSTESLVAAWKSSSLFLSMMNEVESGTAIHLESERVHESVYGESCCDLEAFEIDNHDNKKRKNTTMMIKVVVVVEEEGEEGDIENGRTKSIINKKINNNNNSNNNNNNTTNNDDVSIRTLQSYDNLKQAVKKTMSSHISLQNLTNMNTTATAAGMNDEYTESVVNQAIKPCQIQKWPEDLKESFPGTWYYHFKLTLFRQYLITIRDKVFIFARVFENLFIGGISGSIFANIPIENTQSMMGFLFFGSLYGALAAFAMLPVIYSQKAVYTKQANALFFPTNVYTIAQAVIFYPLQIVESIIFGVLMYWTAGLSANGGRFLTYLLLNLAATLCITQLFRSIAYLLPSEEVASPLGGVGVVFMVLFSEFILPPGQIPPWWIWFYYLNPLAYALKGVVVNEFTSSKYDFDYCIVYSDTTQTTCLESQRYGDFILEAYGFPMEYEWVWYSFIILIGLYVVLFILSSLILKYIHITFPPQLPVEISKAMEEKALLACSQENYRTSELPFTPVSFAFKSISYTVTTSEKEEIELLRHVSGYFEPGTVTALMGTSGAGKTTLLDVLAGRKTTGTIKGDIYINGKPKDQKHFQRIMAYVEQFDSLSPHDTAREAIEFSAALRLPSTITTQDRNQWVDTILTMLELTPIENLMVGKMTEGGMSFEQKKRVSIGMELASNPAVLFLDEPTTGLDSRAAQVVTRSIRRVASSGRSVVCTIHQPSYPIFSSFDSLLLLKRGGQTVYFGQLADKCADLINFFQSIPNVAPIKEHQNPATWMLEVMGNTVSSHEDFHTHYKESNLCLRNTLYTNELCKVQSTVVVAVVEGKGGEGGEGVYTAINDDGINNDDESTSVNVNDRKHPVNSNTTNSSSGSHVSRTIQQQQRQGVMHESLALSLPDTDMNEMAAISNSNNNNLANSNYTTTTTTTTTTANSFYQTSYLHQFHWVGKKIILSYWRTPSYNFGRLMLGITIAFIFSSAYPRQVYDTQTGIIARIGVIYVTSLFLGIVSAETVLPVTSTELIAYYREQMSNMYSPIIYSFCCLLVEIPYVILSSFLFVLPYFFFVGFQNVGNTAGKFGYYWLFMGLYYLTMINLGQCLVAITPSVQTANVLLGVIVTLFTLFAGFMILPQDIPEFWQFAYWLDPQHYVLQGLVCTQFHGDTTLVTTLDGNVITAEEFITGFYSSWSYDQVGICVLALFLFIIGFRIMTTLALIYLRFDKR